MSNLRKQSQKSWPIDVIGTKVKVLKARSQLNHCVGIGCQSAVEQRDVDRVLFNEARRGGMSHPCGIVDQLQTAVHWWGGGGETGGGG